MTCAAALRAPRDCFLALLLAMTSCAAAAAAEGYPTKPVRVVVGFPPGGPVDLQARVLLPKLSDTLRQPIVIDNRPGADGAVGSEVVARAAPDGHTLLCGNATASSRRPARLMPSSRGSTPGCVRY